MTPPPDTIEPEVPANQLSRRLVWRLVSLTALLVILPLVTLSLYVGWIFERDLLPMLDKTSLIAGQAARTSLERAVALGIPFEQLQGTEEFLKAACQTHSAITYMAVINPQGQVLYQYGLEAEQQQLIKESITKSILPSQSLPFPLNLLEPLSDLATTTGLIQTTPLKAQPIGAFYDTTLPLTHQANQIGSLHIGIERQFVVQQFQDIFLDILTMVMVALLIATELLILMVGVLITEPLRLLQTQLHQIAQGDFSRNLLLYTRDDIGRLAGLLNRLTQGLQQAYQRLMAASATLHQYALEHQRPQIASRLTAVQQRFRQYVQFKDGESTSYRAVHMIGVRTAVFLFMCAEELARPFFPIYIKGLTLPSWELPDDVLISIPFTLFMMTVALSMPLAEWVVIKIGTRRAFIGGALLSMVGLIGTGWVDHFHSLLWMRFLCGLGYATMFVSGQSYVLDHAPPDRRTHYVALFVGGVMVAAICGPAIGGVLADRIGFAATFWVGAGLTVIAAGVAFKTMTVEIPHAGASLSPAAFRAVLGNVRFMILLFFAAIPAKLALFGFLFFLVPLALHTLHYSQADIGRIAMTYGLATVVLMPVFAQLADRFKLHGVMVGGGGLLVGAGLITIFFYPTGWSVLIGVIVLGIGQAMTVSPQLVLAMQVCQPQINQSGSATVLGLYRMIERLGGALGPFLVATFAYAFGYFGAIAATGVVLVLTATIFSVAFLILGVHAPAEETDEQDDISVTKMG